MRAPTLSNSTVAWRWARGPIGRPRAAWLLLGLMLVIVVEAGSSSAAGPTRAFLASNFDLRADDFKRLEQGEVVSDTLDASDSREVATLGIVRLRIPPTFYVDHFRDIASFKKDEKILQIGTFGRDPTIADVARLTLDDHDLESLKKCTVGDCDVQLSAEGIERFRAIGWDQPGAADQANRLMRTILVEYVTGYLESGASASMRYADRAEMVNLEHEFASLAESDLGGWGHFPLLRRHLLTYPTPAALATRDILYWSKEKMGRKTVITVTHLAICQGPHDSPTDYAIASKHIYGSHYFDASLGLTLLLQDRSADTPTTYLAYVNRSRIDVFGGLFGPLKRKIVSSKARGLVSDQLARVQASLEQKYGALENRNPADALP